MAREWRVVQVPEEDARIIAHFGYKVTGCVGVAGSSYLNNLKKNASRMLFQIEKLEKLVIKFVWPYSISQSTHDVW